jgi:hypothetical protein
MYVHHYDSQTGAYTASQLAAPDPLDADNWLIPAFSTTNTPPERPRGQWPFFSEETGEWTLRPDWRSIVLYRTDNGEPAEILAPGVTPEQAGLTQTPRPSAEHSWKDGEWQIDADKVLARARADFMQQVELRMDRARQANWGKADALQLGILTPLEAGMYKAWAEYQVALARLIQNADYTRAIQWPDEPNEADVQATVDAEQAEIQRLKDEEAKRAAMIAAQDAERARQAAEWEAREAAKSLTGDLPAADSESAE